MGCELILLCYRCFLFNFNAHIADYIVFMLRGFWSVSNPGPRHRQGTPHRGKEGGREWVSSSSSTSALLGNTLNATPLLRSTYGCHFTQCQGLILVHPSPATHTHSVAMDPVPLVQKNPFTFHPLFSCRGRKAVFFSSFSCPFFHGGGGGWDSWVGVVGSMLKLRIVQELRLLRH